MAYGEKHFITFCDSFGSNYRISVQEIDYVGTSTELIAQDLQISVDYDSDDDNKFEPIIKSSATVNLVFDSETQDFEEFFDADEKTYKIVYTKNSLIRFIGFVLPEDLEYNFTGGKYFATLKATDGLEKLEGLLFLDNNTNQPYGITNLTYNNGFEFPFILLATEILRKLSLDIDTWTLVDVYERNMSDRTSDSRNSDPMAISYVNVKTYINETKRNDIPYWEDAGKVWNCKKVMENLLNIWGCKLYQEDGVWKIKRVTVDAKYGFVYPQLVEGVYFYKSSYNTDGSDVFSGNKDLYSADATLTIGSHCTNAIGGVDATAGYYKRIGIDNIIRIGASGLVAEIISYTQPVYYWYKYNTLAGYIGREEINDTVIVPCSDLIGNDHLMSLDKIYKQFRVNYEYTFIKEGDTPINLLQNGNFAKPYDQYGEIESPPDWIRWRYSNKWYPRLRVDALTGSDITDSGGNTFAVRFGQQFNNKNTKNTDPNPAIWADLRQSGILDNTVSAMKLRFWCKYKFTSADNKVSYYPVMKCFYKEQKSDKSTAKTFNLINSKVQTELEWRETDDKFDDGPWDYVFNTGYFFIANASSSPQFVGDIAQKSSYKWYSFEFDIKAPQYPGEFVFSINGICATSGRKSDNFPPFNTYYYPGDGQTAQGRSLPTVRKDWVDQGGDIPRPMFTGINFGYIPDDSVEVPASDYVYANDNIDYTYQTDPIEVFNGDTVDDEVLSGIKVPLNTTGGMNFWDTAANDFGKTAIGMIACKAIMSQYGLPSRLFEGIAKGNNLKYGTRFVFEAIPNFHFVLLKASFKDNKNYVDATFAQISQQALAKGGYQNGHTLEPIWNATGRVRCVKDISGNNTGEIEIEEVDSNFNSETYGTLRWISGGTDTESCPIGEPSKYYWGTDDAGYNLANFTYFPILFEENNEVQISYSNVGSKYIYFLHLASLGTVNRVANDYQYNIISSFQYFADVTIDGYLYRVLRQDFVTSQFDDFTLTFDFN